MNFQYVERHNVFREYSVVLTFITETKVYSKWFD